MRRVLPIFALLLLGSITYLSAQNLARVFVLGEDEKVKDKLSELYTQPMLAACNNDLTETFQTWLSFTEAVEEYAEKIQYDIKGVRVWLHVFCEGDGTIKNIGYLLRPESKNVNTDEFRAFLSSFMSRYQMPVVSDQGYNHYSKASFPVHTVSYNRD